MIRWTGYALSETAAVVRPFASSHKTRAQAIAAAESSLESDYWAGAATACECWPADSREGEAFEEAAEFAARDGVTGSDLLEDGYTLEAVTILNPAPRRPSVIVEASAVSSLARADLRALWRQYTAAACDDGDEARAGFLALVERMNRYRG